MPSINIGTYVADRVERLGLHIELTDGSVLTIAPIQMWPKVQRDAYNAAFDADDPDAMAHAALGDDAETFLADPNGDPQTLLVMIDDWLDGTLGESSASAS